MVSDDDIVLMKDVGRWRPFHTEREPELEKLKRRNLLVCTVQVPSGYRYDLSWHGMKTLHKARLASQDAIKKILEND